MQDSWGFAVVDLVTRKEDNKLFEADLELAEAAMEGDCAAGRRIGEILLSQERLAMLVKRGAGREEARDIQAELAKGCFSENHERGQLYGLLAKYSGKAPLEAYLNRVALNRLISFKRRQVLAPVSLNSGVGEKESVVQVSEAVGVEREDEVVELLKLAVSEAFSEVDQRALVMLRLVQSYGISQKRVGQLWGWNESMMSRQMAAMLSQLRELILAKISERDPWLQLEWDDFIALCGDSVDLFDYLN